MPQLRFYATLFLLLLSTGTPSIAQTTEPTPETEQYTERSAPRPAEIDEIFSAWDRTRTPGCSLGVYRDGEIVYSRGYGMANLEYGIANSSKTVFRIASTSKQFTAMAIALLAEQGALSLDDDIRKFFPEMPAYGTPITLRHLVHHTSGIRDYLVLADFARMRIFSREEALALLFRQKELNFMPGERYLYSNSNYFLLSKIVEKVTGQSFRAWTTENIFQPLGMEDTHFHDDYTQVVRNRAYGYAPGPDGFHVSMTNLDTFGDGGLLTTVEDLVHWDANFYRPQLGKGDPGLIETIETPGKLADGEKSRYAFGLYVGEYRGVRMLHHDGGYIGARASMNRYPEHRLTVAVLCNLESIDSATLAFKVSDLFLGDALTPPPTQKTTATETAVKAQPVEISEKELRRLSGEFWNEEECLVRKLIVRDGKMFYRIGEGNEMELASLGKDRFLMLGLPFEVTVAFEPVGERSQRVIVTAEDIPSVTLERYRQALPSAEELNAYAGRFHGEELKIDHIVEVREGRLFIDLQGENVALEPVTVDTFHAEGLILNFRRDSDSRVTGYDFAVGRVRNLQFVRVGD